MLLFIVLLVIYIIIEIGKIDVKYRLAGDHQYGKLLFSWLSLVMYLMASFCAVFFPHDVLDEIWD